jgi:hypothetical protein
MQSIQDIVEFENQIQCCMEFESEFSLQMGGNIAKLMNAGWCCENFVHRQDYTLAGEMCGDSYFDLQEHIRGVKDKCKDDTGKANAIVGDLKRTFFTQVFLIGSNIKVLQDEMKLRGKNSNLLDIYVEAFANNIDFNKISLKLGIDEKQVKIEFDKLLNGEHEYSKEMAAKSRPGGMIYDEEILFAHKDNNDFYNLLANKLAITLGLSKEQMAAQKLALFSERDVGKATINRQTIRKDNAQNRTQKDSSEIIHTKEQSINIE